MAIGKGALPEFVPVPGVKIGVASAGIKVAGRKDLVVFEFAEGATTAGVFTQNQFCAAPVTVAKNHLAQCSPRYLLINTGNANAGTGAQGIDDALACCAQVAATANVAKAAVLPFSTGVIGQPLPVDKLLFAIPACIENLTDNQWASAAEGIMTTDTRPKGATRKVVINGQVLSLSGISKGAGMICPNMATMLAFVATDAKISAQALDGMLSRAATQSFNRITVDGDTSTNDACIFTATGKTGNELVAGTSAFAEFERVFTELMLELAQAIVKDAEGVTKFVEVTVAQSNSSETALKVAYAIGHSPLVKTALFASDPNWGRILAVVGRAGIDDLQIDKTNIYLGDVCIVSGGAVSPDYTEERGQQAMLGDSLVIRIELGLGEISESIWTTDLSHDYVTINAEYRT
ncbi:MAG: bifunctional ornithine acetyltransferase/N-acetylglutamate synthase [Gammaproteobacteria bacterium]|nr:MAG: bifunctional ornithine acetyltransferase/N-acetylglutamate synthase [Gammaproteobacteria bacterium]